MKAIKEKNDFSHNNERKNVVFYIVQDEEFNEFLTHNEKCT